MARVYTIDADGKYDFYLKSDEEVVLGVSPDTLHTHNTTTGRTTSDGSHWKLDDDGNLS